MSEQTSAFQKIDILLAIIIGEVCAWLLILIAKNLAVIPAGLNLKSVLPILLPLLCAVGIIFAWWLAKLWNIIYQIAKFALVGVLNTLVDWGVLNLLIFLSAENMTGGWYYSLFKSCSFVVANVNSYLWNRFWVFKKTKEESIDSTGKNFLQFLAVSVIGFLLNVSVASLVVNFGGQYWADYKILANLGAVAGTVVALIWNFLGYKLIVFKK